MLFNDINCNNNNKKSLINIAKKNLYSSALLLYGPDGNAKLALALALATYINCHKKKDDDSCGECQSCTKMKKFIHPDVYFSFPVGNMKEIKSQEVISKTFLPQWRNFLSENIYGNLFDWAKYLQDEPKKFNISKEEATYIKNYMAIKPFYGKYKISIIWLPEYMHNSAASSLLKLIEEPPQNSIFILTSDNITSILSTIKSRLQHHYIYKFSTTEIIQYLKQESENDKINNKDTLYQIATICNGNLNKAYSIIKEQYNYDFLEKVITWMRLCYKNNFPELLNEAINFNNMGTSYQKNFFIYFTNIIREVTISLYRVEKISYITQKEKDFVDKFSATINVKSAIEIMQHIANTYMLIDRNANIKMAFLLLSLDISKILQQHKQV